MPTASIDGVEIFYETAGEGAPLIFLHEFAGDRRGLALQMRHFSRRYRCVSYNYRGYPPSSVPANREAYGPDVFVSDLAGLLDHLEFPQAHLFGFATGGGIALNFAIHHPDRVRSLALIGPGAGGDDPSGWYERAQRIADKLLTQGLEPFVTAMNAAPPRQHFRNKDPQGWQEFVAQMRELSPLGLANTMGNVLAKRKALFELGNEITSLKMPILVLAGDQDTPAFNSCVFVSRTAPFGALGILPSCGHMLPLEEPAQLNAMVQDFLTAVDSGRWGKWKASAVSAG